MCDCPEKNADTNQRVPETVTLYKKCSKPYRPEKDPAKRSSCDGGSNKDDWVPTDSSQSDLGYTICDGFKGSLADSSCTSSTRTVLPPQTSNKQQLSVPKTNNDWFAPLSNIA